MGYADRGLGDDDRGEQKRSRDTFRSSAWRLPPAPLPVLTFPQEAFFIWF